MIDLTTKYLGMELRNPIVASASPLSESLDNIRRLEDHGIGAIVLPSLFEEQLDIESETVDSDLSRGAEEFAEAVTYLPGLMTYNLGPDGYLNLIHKAKASVQVPIIASLNGVSPRGWVRYAREMEQAGADAIELNIYSLVADPEPHGNGSRTRLLRSGWRGGALRPGSSRRQVVAFLYRTANMSKRLDASGADALVLFNRFYQPDLDIETLEVVPNLTLSHPTELLLRLHWVAIIFGHVEADLAITGGVHSATDIIKSVMAGARVAMMASALLKNGIGHLDSVREDLVRWMEEHEYSSIGQMCGSMSQRNVPDPTAFERANYMKVLSSYALRAR